MLNPTYFQILDFHFIGIVIGLCIREHFVV